MLPIKILFLLSLIGISLQFGFTPKSLYAYYTDEYIFMPSRRDYSNKIIDPNDYLKNYEKIVEKMKEIETKKNIYTIVIFIKEIDPNYKAIKANPIRAFAGKFAELYFENDKEMQFNSMVIVFSYEDRKMRISVGNNLRKEYTDFYNGKIKESITDELEVHKFDEAVINLLEKVLNFEEFKKQVGPDSPTKNIVRWILGGVIGIVAMLLILRYGGCCMCCLEKTVKFKVEEIDDFIKGMEKASKKGKDKEKEFMKEFCLICLGEIDQDILEDFEDFENEQNMEVELEVRDDKSSRISEGILLEKEQDQKRSERITLECGHEFHKGCLEHWKRRSRKCPICKENVDEYDADPKFGKSILNIHKAGRPELHGCNLVIEDGTYVAKKTVPIWYRKHRRPKITDIEGGENKK